MNLDRSHVIVGLLSAIVGAAVAAGITLVTWGATYGRMDATVKQLDDRVGALEHKAMPGVKVGDLCMRLMDSEVNALNENDSNKQTSVDRELERMHCYNGVPTNATKPDPNYRSSEATSAAQNVVR